MATPGVREALPDIYGGPTAPSTTSSGSDGAVARPVDGVSEGKGGEFKSSESASMWSAADAPEDIVSSALRSIGAPPLPAAVRGPLNVASASVGGASRDGGRSRAAGGGGGGGAASRTGRAAPSTSVPAGFMAPMADGSRVPASRVAKLPESQLTPDDIAFFAELKPYRNFFFVSHYEELRDHVSVNYAVPSGPPRKAAPSVPLRSGDGEEEAKRGHGPGELDGAGGDGESHGDEAEDVDVTRKKEHFSGSTERMRRGCSVVRGPCCNWGGSIEGLDAPKVASDADARLMCDMAASEIRKVEPGALGVRSTYIGRFRAITLTELVVRTEVGRSIKDDLTDEITGQLEELSSKREPSPASELEKLDLDMMLSILGPRSSVGPSSFAASPRSPGSPGSAGGAGREAASRKGADGDDSGGQRAVVTASITLFLDEAGRVLNADYWTKQRVRLSVGSLAELRPRRASPWVDFAPDVPGSLVLARADEAGAAALASAALLTVAALDSNTYESPLKTIQFLWGDQLLPVGYRERRILRLLIRGSPVDLSGGGGDALSALSPPKASPRVSSGASARETGGFFSTNVELAVDIHAAFHSAPFRASVEVSELSLHATLEVSLRGSPSAQLSVWAEGSDAVIARAGICGAVTVAPDGGVALRGVGLLATPLRVALENVTVPSTDTAAGKTVNVTVETDQSEVY